MKKKRRPSPPAAMKDIMALAEQLNLLKEEARRLGVFTNDRELLDCTKCGLMEDVTIDGILITIRSESQTQDTGLRFLPVGKGGAKFRCPACGKIVRSTIT
ncbi:MAG: hypothetical protein ACRD22_01840 [Terriglobia bacterium]